MTIPPSSKRGSDALAEVHRLWREDRAALEAQIMRLREALEEIKRTAAIEAPPVSEEVPAKVWKIAFEALGDG